MRRCAELHSSHHLEGLVNLDCVFETTLPGLSDKSMSFLTLVQWATSNMQEPDWEQKMALDFLDRCLDLDRKSVV